MTTPANQPDLIAWLRARYDERERAAIHAGDDDTARRWTATDDGFGCRVMDGNGDVVVYDEGSPTPAQARHIAANDPAWVLADLESKRRILDALDLTPCPCSRAQRCVIHDSSAGPPEFAVQRYVDPVTEVVLSALALPFAGHPDYREEFRP